MDWSADILAWYNMVEMRNFETLTNAMTTTNVNFYQQLPILEKFVDVADPDSYRPLPEDWLLALADVRGSMTAIQQGQYKAVNMVGAAVITAILNQAKPLPIPFIFGGDGASLAVPPTLADAAAQALQAARRMAAAVYNLDLRVGIIPAAVVRAAGYDIRVARFRVSANYNQAVFSGGGLAYAEALLKDEAAGRAYRLDDPAPDAQADFAGLECRWQTVPSPHGETTALLVLALGEDMAMNAAVYRQALERVQHIYGPLPNSSPIALEQMRMTLREQDLRHETAVRSFGGSRWDKFKYQIWIRFTSLLGIILTRYEMTAFGLNWGKYKRDVALSADVRKFDDMVRQILSGTAAQRAELTAYLEEEYRRGRLVYGLHVSDASLMTCVIMDRLNEHFHFVDGAGGGYAQAAQEMKKRLVARQLK